MDLAADLASQARIHFRQARMEAVSGAKSVGSDFFKQMLGRSQTPVLTSAQIAEKEEATAKLDQQAYLETRAKVQAIYEEHRTKRLQEEQARQQQVQIEETKKLEELNQKRAMHQDVANAIGKSSAETGRNYGAE
jgi:hypothetical protein